MSTLFEEQVELVRDDDVRVPALRITPDDDDAPACNGAGVVVISDPKSATAERLEQVVRALARFGYVVVSLAVSDGGDAAIEDLQAAILSVKELARGKIGVVGVGEAATVALAAAAVLPQIDAVVHAGGRLPGAEARLGRARAAVLIHQAARGSALSADDLTALQTRLKRSKAPLTIRRHDDTDEGFFGGITVEAIVAWAQTRDFLTFVLT